MDWTKAKTILIIALLITNLIIGYFYSEKIREAEKQQFEQAISTREFLEQKGVSLLVEIPTQPLKLPVLFVHFEPLGEGQQIEPVYHEGILVEASDYKDNLIVPISYGETKRDLFSASYALLKSGFAFSEEKDSQLVINDIQLIYFVENSEYDKEISEDTAVPTWKISSESGEVFYVNAYGE
ncbi:MAG: hypothetical protein EOM59_05620 [Clostridia bacterium]|nr:hypothetical protein [Clostridia bacterium]